ncbi:MAG: substrate-binding domain-containing protein, partial [Anaerolineales bacterium]
MKHTGFFWLFAVSLLVACAPSSPATTPVPITVQYTFATTSWLKNLYACAGNQTVRTELRAADFQDINSTNLVIRLGQPENLTTPAFQIGTDDLLVIANPNNPINKLTADQVHNLFTGRTRTWKAINGTDASVQVWIFPIGEDVQKIFKQTVLGGSPVTSQARLANSPDEMSQAISNDVNAVGILTRRWKTKSTSEVFIAASNLPVL